MTRTISREEAIKTFVENYDIEVQDSLVENELQYLTLELKHKRQYDVLMGGRLLVGAPINVDEQMEELKKIAVYEVKYKCVIDDMLSKYDFSVTQEEREAEAVAMAERQGSTVEMVKKFFGEDLLMLDRDIKERKVIDAICLSCS